ncbi:MAG: alpha/beta hydrolase fold domain-containing protein [Chloroflexi bacterium]|nr:alpha/beta hydrolase fold domain-containing protein [Chloroflexota bacterium]MBT4141650.1 alpha/beta hydrolase fold domain-containing protein [Chloroflexota bacterium]MBT4943865.1 alpha/beta hydrolase fold domain-containing protein [Chloroflexota bacterium]MBT5253384.1 alpha/beta hydrolase fold domain-containing protein [Chloroflexota bacterium]MBT7005081.1 alpha/beta hydrolase fold domain-containing protein [Chloroflexota bacterium]
MRICDSDGGGSHSLAMLFHGGVWVASDVDAEDMTSLGLPRQDGAAVLSADYRLAPETRFPR